MSDIDKLMDHLPVTARSDREKLAAAARILGAAGHGSGLAGQLTLRADPNSYWTLPLGFGLEEADPQKLIRVDGHMHTIEGEGIANPAVRFHLWIYRARADVLSIVHTHPPSTCALSMLGRPLAVAHMDAMMFFDDCAYLPEWPGVPLADEEGRIISTALGDKRSILLANHGLLTAASSIEEATYLAYFMERVARAQLDAEAVGPIQTVDPDHARAAHDFLLRPEVVGATFEYLARVAGADKVTRAD